jgi:hypothetical protein
MKTENQNFTKHYELIPEDHIIIGWGYPEPDMDADGRIYLIPRFDLTDAFTAGDVSEKELSWLESIVGSGSTRCNHCGKSMKYFALVKNQENSRAHIIGTQCASSMIGYRQEKVDAMHKTTLKARQKIGRVQKKRQAKKDAQAFLDNHKGLERALRVDHYISSDLSIKLQQYGSISEKQIKLAFKIEKQAEERKQKQAEREAQGKSSNHVGEVGDRIKNVKCTGVFSRSFDGNFGTFYIVKFITAQGDTLVYKGSVPYRADQYECELSFTVKAHEEYQGEKQTVIQRVKEIDPKKYDELHILKKERASIK